MLNRHSVTRDSYMPKKSVVRPAAAKKPSLRAFKSKATEPVSQKSTKRPITPDEAKIGAALKQAFIRAGKPRDGLAKALDCGTDNLRWYWDGTSCTRMVSLKVICRFLHVTPNEILGFATPEFDEKRLQGAIEASYETLGCDPENAEGLAQRVLSASKAAPISSAHLDPEDDARVQFELANRAFLGAQKKGN